MMMVRSLWSSCSPVRYIDIDKNILENIDIDIDKEILENIDIDIDIDKEILKNIDIDINIDKEISGNIDVDKISNQLEFGISNRATSMSATMSTFMCFFTGDNQRPQRPSG